MVDVGSGVVRFVADAAVRIVRLAVGRAALVGAQLLAGQRRAVVAVVAVVVVFVVVFFDVFDQIRFVVFLLYGQGDRLLLKRNHSLAGNRTFLFSVQNVSLIARLLFFVLVVTPRMCFSCT